MTQGQVTRSRYGRWLPWIGGLVGLVTLALVLRRFDLDRFLTMLAGAKWQYLIIIVLAIAGEQLVRAWKWRQLLYPLRPVGTLRLFGAIMAGYLIAFMVPFGVGTVARSWLIAQRESLKLSAVLASVALDRLTDGVLFACLVPIALLTVVFPDPTGNIRAGLIWAGSGSFVVLALLLFALAAYRHGAIGAEGRVSRLVARLPARVAGPIRKAAMSFAEGIVWPRQHWRGAGIVMSTACIKLIAATDFLWAGLAFGVVLQPAQYLFLIVFLGFLLILGHFIRLAGSFLIGSVFVLGLFGVTEEAAFAMALVAEGASILSICSIGALAMWRQGVALAEVRAAESDGSVRSA